MTRDELPIDTEDPFDSPSSRRHEEDRVSRAPEISLSHAEHLLALRRLPQALAAFADPHLAAAWPDSCAAGRWQCHMLLGDLAGAWVESDGLRQRGSPDPHRFWDGSPLHGKRVMLRCLHGLGDAIQFLRYAPFLESIASHLIVEVPPPLLELAPFLKGPHEVITWGENAPAIEPAWDSQIELMELPYIFRSTLADLPAPNAGLSPSLADRSESPSTGSRPRIGIVWSGGSWNTSRSIPFTLLEPLLSTGSHLSLFSLQPSTANAEWNAITDRCSLQPSDASLDAILPLARFIAGLDLVITVDTLAAHLAAALGRPTWILLQYQADWRWLHERSDTPWYPAARLFRQSVQGDWVSLIDRVRHELLLWSDNLRHTEIDHAHLG